MTELLHASSLVSSSDVNGTNVYSPSGDHIGHIDHLMIDKKTGRVAYSVMAYFIFRGKATDLRYE